MGIYVDGMMTDEMHYFRFFTVIRSLKTTQHSFERQWTVILQDDMASK